MPLQRHLRLIAAGLALSCAVGFGLADWSGGPGGYVVRPGDSLWAIASAHGLTVAQLAAANRLNPDDILPIGRHLTLPSKSSARLVSVQAATPAGPRPSAWTFCSSFRSSPGPWGSLPSQLAGSSRYYSLAPVFRRWAAYYGVSLPLLEAVAWQESGWQQGVVSSTGAIGVGQIEPYTATFISNDLVGMSLNVKSVSDNIRMSAAFIAYLSRVEGNNRCATIAAYYEGPVNLQALGVFSDTAQYVASVEALVPRFG